MRFRSAGDNRLRKITRARDEAPNAAQTLRELVAGPLPEDIEASYATSALLSDAYEESFETTELNFRRTRLQLNSVSQQVSLLKQLLVT